MNRNKIILKILPYVAGTLFAGMWAAAMEVSSELSGMENAGLNVYHDVVDIKVLWFQSRACIMLPPDNFQVTCRQVHGLGLITLFTILLIGVLIVYMVIRRKYGSVK